MEAATQELLARPLAEAEFLCVDVETNGAPGEDCEVTEVATVLVGGGALPDAETCARVFCALFPRLCANAPTVADALALFARRRGRRGRRRPPGRLDAAAGPPPGLDFSGLPPGPGVYVFRDTAGHPLYV